MKILIVAAKKNNGCFSPFVDEQALALRALTGECADVVEYVHTAHGIENYIKWVPRLRKAIKEIKPDVVHAHFGLTGLMAGLAAIGTGVPVVVTYHGCDINDTKLRPFSRMAMRLAAWNIFVSKRQMVNAYGTEARAAEAKKACIMPCGIKISQFDEKYVDGAWFEAKFGKGDKVLFAGSFESYVKNPGLAKAVIARLNEKINIDKHSCADINIENNLDITKKDESELACSSSNNLDPKSAHMQASGQPSAQSCSVSLADSSDKKTDVPSSQKNPKNEVELIELRGYTREQVVTLMYKCKALLLTSIREGSPQVVKEAMACGCPIVTTDVGDVRERLDGVSGCYVVDSGELIVDRLAEAVEMAIAYGRTKGREKLMEEGLDNEQIARKLISIYQNVTKKEK